jgi:pimeloyl-ACP methyl ester carboxylesterase
MRKIRWSRGETAVIEAGEGEPLLLVHGGLGDAFAWAPIFPHLAGSFHAIAVDLPGHGLADSYEFKGEELLSLMSRFLREITTALELRRTAVCGSSLGGLFSSRFAVDAPDLVSRLVVIGMPGGYKRGVPLPLRMLGLPVIGRPLGRLVMSKPTRAGNRKFWGQILVAHPERIDDAVLDADVASQVRNKGSQLSFITTVLNGRGLRPELIEGSQWDVITTPTLFVWGESDVYGSPEEGESLVARNPALRLARVPDAGHLAWFDAPETVTKEIRAFLG